MTTKRCSKCHQEKPLSAFHKDVRQPLGVGAWCKACKGVKDADRFVLPDLCPQRWLDLYCEHTQCLRCGATEKVNLYINGAIPTPHSINDAKESARLGEVFCADCVAVPLPMSTKVRLKIRRRSERVEERIKDVDFFIEKESQLAARHYLREREAQTKNSAYVHDEVVDAYTKRHADRTTRKELDERFPIVTEKKSETYRRKVVAYYRDDPLGNDFEDHDD